MARSWSCTNRDRERPLQRISVSAEHRTPLESDESVALRRPPGRRVRAAGWRGRGRVRIETASGRYNVFLFQLSTGRLWNLTNQSLFDDLLADVSVLPDGEVVVVYESRPRAAATTYFCFS